MEVKISWNGPSGMSFRAETGSGHMVNMDGAPEGGGHNLAPRPMEMVLLGTGGCTAYDVVLILKRGREDVRGCDVTLKAERADTDPMRVADERLPRYFARARAFGFLAPSGDKNATSTVRNARSRASPVSRSLGKA